MVAPNLDHLLDVEFPLPRPADLRVVTNASKYGYVLGATTHDSIMPEGSDLSREEVNAIYDANWSTTVTATTGGVDYELTWTPGGPVHWTIRPWYIFSCERYVVSVTEKDITAGDGDGKKYRVLDSFGMVRGGVRLKWTNKVAPDFKFPTVEEYLEALGICVAMFNRKNGNHYASYSTEGLNLVNREPFVRVGATIRHRSIQASVIDPPDAPPEAYAIYHPGPV